VAWEFNITMRGYSRREVDELLRGYAPRDVDAALSEILQNIDQ
jgi:cell division septum initiation protein DivIVA